MRAPGEPTVLRRLAWFGPDPDPGDVLETATGRRYRILETRGASLHCVVMRAGETADTRTFRWTWASRRQRRLAARRRRAEA